MLTGMALILIACFVVMPKAIMITLCVFGALLVIGFPEWLTKPWRK